MIFDFGIEKLRAWAPSEGDAESGDQLFERQQMRWTRSQKFKATNLNPRLSRRMSGMSKLTVSLATEASEDQSFQHAVFSSRFGEMENTYTLVKMLSESEELSPMKFSQSVHNTASGLFSIQGGSQVSMESVSAGGNSFAMGLVASLTYLKSNPGSKVLFVHSDFCLPEALKPFTEEAERDTVAVAMVLSKGNDFRLEGQSYSETQAPQGQTLDFLKKIFCENSNSVEIQGKNFGWRFDFK